MDKVKKTGFYELNKRNFNKLVESLPELEKTFTKWTNEANRAKGDADLLKVEEFSKKADADKVSADSMDGIFEKYIVGEKDPAKVEKKWENKRWNTQTKK